MDLETAIAQALQQAEALLQTGKRAEAQKILVEVVQRVPQTDHAWYLLSYALTERQSQVKCLLSALEINPHHQEALARLAKIAPNVKPPEPAPPPEPSYYEPAVVEPAAPDPTPPPIAGPQDLFSLRAKLQSEAEAAPPPADKTPGKTTGKTTGKTKGKATAPPEPEPQPLPRWLEPYESQIQQFNATIWQPTQRRWRRLVKRNPRLPSYIVGVVISLIGLCLMFYGGMWAWDNGVKELFAPTRTPTATRITFPTFPPEWTVTPTPSRTPAPTLTPTVTFTPTETGTPTPSPTATRRR